MGFFDSVSKAITNTVNSVADVVSSVGKATGLDGVAKSLNLAGTGSNAGEVAAIAAAIATGYYYSAPVAAADAAAYSSATATASTAVEVGAGSIVDGVVVQGGMSIPASSIASGMTLADGTQVITTTSATGLDSILANSATSSWAATTVDALKTANSAVSLMRIVNGSGATQIVPKNSPIPAGWSVDKTYVQPTATTGATVSDFMPQQNSGGGGLLFLLVGAAILYKIGNKK